METELENVFGKPEKMGDPTVFQWDGEAWAVFIRMHDHYMDFVVCELADPERPDELMYLDRFQKPTTDVAKARQCMRGHVKYDGCCNYTIGCAHDPKDMLQHICGVSGFDLLAAQMRSVYHLASRMKSWIVDEVMFPIGTAIFPIT